MEKFIVWDTEINKPVVVATIEDYISVNFKDRCRAFKDIGIKDINKNSIYADNSIVEFKLNNHRTTFDVVGVFKFHKERLIYFIEILKCDEVENYSLGLNTIPYDVYRNIISDIKIIDTVQENKLGLIKE